jgi:hypothetical protein
VCLEFYYCSLVPGALELSAKFHPSLTLNLFTTSPSILNQLFQTSARLRPPDIMAAPTLGGSTGKKDMTDQLRAQPRSPSLGTPDDTWSEAAVLWIQLYYDLLSAAVSAPSEPIVFASNTMVYEEFNEYFEVNSVVYPEVQATAHKIPKDEFQAKVNALVPEELAKVTAIIRRSIKRENPTMVDSVAIDPNMLERYKQLRDAYKLEEEVDLPEHRAALMVFVNDALRKQHPHIYTPNAGHVRATCEGNAVVPNLEDRAVADHGKGQPDVLQDEEIPTPTAPRQASLSPHARCGIRSVLVFRNVRKTSSVEQNAFTKWEKRDTGKRTYIERKHAATDINQPYHQEQEEPAYIASTSAARSKSRASSKLPTSTRRKASTQPHNQPAFKRSKTAESATDTAATTTTRDLRNSQKTAVLDTVSNEPVQESVKGGQPGPATAVQSSTPATATTEKKRVKKVDWLTEEFKALYRFIIQSCKNHGLDTVTQSKNTVFLEDCTNYINAECADLNRDRSFRERNTEMVHSKLRHPVKDKTGRYDGHPFKALFARAQVMKRRVDNGEDIPHEERYPDQVIAEYGTVETDED